MGYDFLSDEWFTEVQKISDGAGDLGIPADLMSLTVNMVVTGGPDGEKQMHFKGGTMGPGHDDSGKTEVTVPYDLARKLMIENDMGAAMSGFMSGQIKIKGDMTKLMGMQTLNSNPKVKELMEKVLEVTNV